MKMMGLPAWMHWTSWFINSILTAALSSTIIVLLLHLVFKEGTMSLSLSL